MERKYVLAFIALIAIIALLMAILIAGEKEDMPSVSLEKELAKSIRAQYGPDVNAAIMAWTASGQKVPKEMTIEADGISTPWFVAALDPANPDFISFNAAPGSVGAGEVRVVLGKYYEENMTRVPGWSVTYLVNTTTHKVAGLTAGLIQNIAYNYYVEKLNPDIYVKLGVSADAIVLYSPRTLDTSYNNGQWLDVTEYMYSYKNTDVNSYLLIKTYVDAQNQSVISVEIVGPYFGSVA